MCKSENEASEEIKNQIICTCTTNKHDVGLSNSKKAQKDQSSIQQKRITSRKIKEWYDFVTMERFAKKIKNDYYNSITDRIEVRQSSNRLFRLYNLG